MKNALMRTNAASSQLATAVFPANQPIAVDDQAVIVDQNKVNAPPPTTRIILAITLLPTESFQMNFGSLSMFRNQDMSRRLLPPAFVLGGIHKRIS
jgi:hypothetical protein